MSAGHTEGEWEIVPYGDGDSLVVHAINSDWRICFMATPGSSPNAMNRIKANARLIVAACNSYQRHCTDPVSAAEGDLLGRCVEALRINVDSNKAELASLLNSVCLHDSNGPVRGTAELDSLPDVERLENAIYEGESILSQVREVRS